MLFQPGYKLENVMQVMLKLQLNLTGIKTSRQNNRRWYDCHIFRWNM